MLYPAAEALRVLIAAFSDDPKQWIGQRMTLFCDPDVLWAGVKVGGIRISHLSGLEHPRTFMLTQSRGKRSEVTVRPIGADKPALTPEEQEYVTAATAELQGAASIDELRIYGQVIKGKSKPIQDALRPVYAARKQELSKPPGAEPGA